MAERVSDPPSRVRGSPKLSACLLLPLTRDANAASLRLHLVLSPHRGGERKGKRCGIRCAAQRVSGEDGVRCERSFAARVR